MKKKIHVRMTKYFVGGLLEGMTVEDKMTFVDWSYACAWAGAVTRNPKCDYVVLEMTGENGEHDHF